MAQARLSIMRAQRQLAAQADVHVHVRKFKIINQVGAVFIRARLDCDAFASTHSSTSHFDKSSFVGLAWRPPGESICCEVYSTGRAKCARNLQHIPQYCSVSCRMPCRVLAAYQGLHANDNFSPALGECFPNCCATRTTPASSPKFRKVFKPSTAPPAIPQLTTLDLQNRSKRRRRRMRCGNLESLKSSQKETKKYFTLKTETRTF